MSQGAQAVQRGCCWGVGVTQGSGGKASPICALAMIWGGQTQTPSLCLPFGINL